MYVGFMAVEKAYDSVNREALCQVLRIYDIDSKLQSGIKSMYVNILSCVRVKRGEGEYFRIEGGVRQACIISPWLFNGYMDAMMEEVKEGMGRMDVKFVEEEREWRLPFFCIQITWFCIVSRERPEGNVEAFY